MDDRSWEDPLFTEYAGKIGDVDSTDDAENAVTKGTEDLAENMVTEGTADLAENAVSAGVANSAEDIGNTMNAEESAGAESAYRPGEFDFPLEEEPIVIRDASLPAPEQEKKETKKSAKIGTIFCVAFIVLALSVAGVLGIITLSRKGDMKTLDGDKYTYESGTWTKFQVYYAMPGNLTMTHRVNYIPTAKEYYYLVLSADLSSIAVIRADKSWYDDNFTDWYANDENGVTVEGYVRKTDNEVVREMETEISSFQIEYGKSFRADTSLYVDTIATRISIYEIIIMAVPLICVILFFTVGRKYWNYCLYTKEAKYFLAVLLVGGLVYGGFVIHVLEFVM